jgi:hypothetical protein
MLVKGQFFGWLVFGGTEYQGTENQDSLLTSASEEKEVTG